MEVDKITFMGHQVTRNGLEIDPEMVEAIQNIKQPTCVEEILWLDTYLVRLMYSIHYTI